MHETGKVGIATLILRDKEHLVAVRPGEDVLILETMYFADEIRTPSEELDSLPQDATFAGRELEVAKKLVESLTVEWSPEDYHNTYRARVEEVIERKREGHAVVFEKERPKSNVIDLMAALEASVARTGESRAAEAAPPDADQPATPASEAKQQDLDEMTKAELLARAAELDIQGRSKMTKPELIEAIGDAAAPKRRGRKIS
jgi:DNA end-binding protein Ku